MDYVHGYATQKAHNYRSVDDAATKIGLGWRVLEKDQSNKIEGKKACTDFLSKIVDALLAEIFERSKRLIGFQH